MSVLVCTLQGRSGNQTLQWLFAYAFAQKHCLEFQCDEWIGERIFDLPQYARPTVVGATRFNESTIESGLRHINIEYRGYAQTQLCANYYTKRQAQSWLKLKPEVESICHEKRRLVAIPPDSIICHLRRGDYVGYGYPMPSQASYIKAMERFGLDWRQARFLSEEHPTYSSELPDDIKFMPDFYRMMSAPTLLRANSTFSWLAGLLSNGLVLSPVIDGLEGGKEHYVRFVAGNHPRLANFDFTTDLYVNP